jgi:hypothetical protein
MRRLVLMALGVVLALSLAAPAALGQVRHDPNAYGKGAAALAADWWTWALSKPAAESPLLGSYSDDRCDGQPVTSTPGDVWFLAGVSLSGDPAVRTCTVPADTSLFFPAANYVYVNTDPGETQRDARRFAKEFIDELLAAPDLSIAVTVDGTEVPSDAIVRADSSLFTIPLPKDNLFGIDPGNYYRAVADGLWVTLPPLSEGEHTIHIEVSAPSVGFSQDVTYNLTVQ